MSLETCVGSTHSSNVFQGSLYPIRQARLTPDHKSANLEGTHKRYLYGPGSILVAHSDHEHLKASDLLAAVEGYKKLIRSALTL